MFEGVSSYYYVQLLKKTFWKTQYNTKTNPFILNPAMHNFWLLFFREILMSSLTAKLGMDKT